MQHNLAKANKYEVLTPEASRGEKRNLVIYKGSKSDNVRLKIINANQKS